MLCAKVTECICPKKSCRFHGICCECVSYHVRQGDKDYLPYCLFPDSNGDKSKENLYRMLKAEYGEGKKQGQSCP